MKYYFLSLGILTTIVCQAQKKYDYTDTRKKNESFGRIQQKDIRADLSSFTLAGVSESIGKSDLEKISFSSIGPDSIVFNSGDIKAKVTIADFDGAKHKLEYDEKYLIKIDRKSFYGGYGFLPKTYIKHIIFVSGNDTILIPTSAYADLYNLNLSYMNKGIERTANAIYSSRDGHKLYLYLLCKDITGSYEVTFVIVDKKYFRRVLDYDLL